MYIYTYMYYLASDALAHSKLLLYRTHRDVTTRVFVIDDANWAKQVTCQETYDVMDKLGGSSLACCVYG